MNKKHLIKQTVSNKKATARTLGLSVLTCSMMLAMGTATADEAKATTVAEAFTQGSAKVDLNLRYENVAQDNALKDADALTLRTRLTFATADYYGLSALVEFEDSRQVAGVNDYNDAVGNNPEYSVIADPETTELDQAFLQYKNSGFQGRLGRQVIALDNMRFIGHVGWRQDRQTFDALALQYAIDGFTIDYDYIYKRNRIFAEAKDVDSKDHIVNASYKFGVGKLSAYGYMLEEDKPVENGIDTYGVRFAGATDLDAVKLLYAAEYATQDSDSAGQSFSADYMLGEIGVGVSGITVKLGYEVLGSDDGEYGFSTPLATLHGFNGWSDQFLSTPKEGLADLYASIGGGVIGGKWALIYHDFSADKSSATVDDLGSEINAVFSVPVQKHYTLGVKYAAYSAGDAGAAKVDTDKVWLWANAKF
ncbi:alginate export family protein [Shewanella gaetbuli]|uniref:Alginate export family protein n=1 Tax=Shewanella gaetbuli TaxID=220752 RepID=A0A9X2CHA2_9GAMM|nr:alginate export family protein [Shewanella gaetbuli]MCL1141812.1 alginate export family protein [Shewanella gaetbuli]